MRKLSIFILSLLVGICLGEAGLRLLDFAMGNIPPAKVGECLELHYSEYSMVGKVMSNDKRAHKSVLGFPILESNQIILEEYSFEDLRDLKAKRINCNEKVIN